MFLPKLSVLFLIANAALSIAASLIQVEDFGKNPTNIYMYIYVPDKVATNPAVIVAVSTRNNFNWKSSTRNYIHGKMLTLSLLVTRLW